MENAGVVEGTLPTEQRPETTEKTTVAKLLFAMTGLYERWRNEMVEAFARLEKLLTALLETRRYRDPREHDEDYGNNLRRLEGGIEESEPPLRMRDYHEGGGEKDTSWQKWILGIVSLSLVGMLSWALGKLDTLNQEVATLQATQTMGFAAIAQRQTADEQRIDRIEGRVYRGSP
jgi:hypothetical protein